MRIKFKQNNEESILVIGINDEGEEKEIGHIFTPSSSGHNNLNAIQICGFSEAFDLWGCAMYKTPKLKENDCEYVYEDGKKVFQQAKDIQLMFDFDTEEVSNKDHLHKPITRNCWRCFNEPCTCELRIKHENPYAVKREQDLPILKKKDVKN